MRLPERPARGGAAHAEAIDRLDEARAARDRLTDIAEAAEGTPQHAQTMDARDAAEDRFAAVEASLIRIERGN